MSKAFMIRATEGVIEKHKEEYMTIKMIKALREATGQSLPFAKENVEELLRGGVVIISTVDPYFGDRKRTLYTAKIDINRYPNYFIIQDAISENKDGEMTINITQGEAYFILSCVEGRRAMVEMLTPGDFGEDETSENITKLINKIKEQTSK